MVTIDRLLSLYLPFAEGYYPDEKANASSEFGHLRRVGFLLSQFAGDEPAADFGPKRLKAFQAYLVTASDEEGKPLNWSRPYINHQIQRVRRIFKWGVSEELIGETVHRALLAVPPLKSGRTQARETQDREPVEWSVVEATLPFLSPVVRAMVLLQSRTGARSENVCRLRPVEIDRSEAIWVWQPTTHKTKHRGGKLVIFIGRQGQGILSAYLDRDPESYCFSPVEDHHWRSEQRRANRKTPLTPSQSKRRRRPSSRLRTHFDPRSYCRSIKAAIRRANQAREEEAKKQDRRAELLPLWTPHQLRHARGTQIKEEYGMEGAQAALGHASLSATQLYTKRMLDLAKRIAQDSG